MLGIAKVIQVYALVIISFKSFDLVDAAVLNVCRITHRQMAALVLFELVHLLLDEVFKCSDSRRSIMGLLRVSLTFVRRLFLIKSRVHRELGRGSVEHLVIFLGDRF